MTNSLSVFLVLGMGLALAACEAPNPYSELEAVTVDQLKNNEPLRDEMTRVCNEANESGLALADMPMVLVTNCRRLSIARSQLHREEGVRFMTGQSGK